VTASRSPLARAIYRGAQCFRGFVTVVDPDDARAVAALLSPQELQLFLAQRPRDRRHAVLTMRHLERIATAGASTPSEELLTAALLHDIGKGPLHVGDRVLYVLLEALSPTLVDRFADEHASRLRSALWRLRHHASLGAAQLIAAGSAPRVVELIVAHHLPATLEGDHELAWLLAADESA
jgi:putative nucleotidyltransferase with HDIG domain